MKVYFDIDGVLGEFEAHVENTLGKKDAHKDLGKSDLWKQFSTLKKHIPQFPDWWEDMPAMPGSSGMVKTAQRLFGVANVGVISAYASWDLRSKQAKPGWVAKHFPSIPAGNLIICRRDEKKQYAITQGSSNILVDDYPKNIAEWEKAGGSGIVFVSPDQVAGDLKKLQQKHKQ